MKVTLEFNLPYDEYNYDRAINGHKYYSVITELDKYLRDKQKYKSVEEISIDNIRTIIRNYFDDEGLTIDF